MNRIKIIKFIARLIVVMGFLVTQTSFAAIFVLIPGVGGDATDNAHKDWIEILRVSSAALNEVPRGGCSLPNNPDQVSIVIEKTIDKSTPKLQEALCGGRNFFNEVEIHLHSNGAGAGQSYYRYKLKNVIVSSYSVSGSAQGKGKPIPVEEITLNYEEIEVSYEPQGHGEKNDRLAD
jgi:type VI secretion system secreted protein Hcp